MSPIAALLFATALAAACATPGPATMAVVARVLARGLHGSSMLCLGLLLGDVFWLSCAAFGMAALAQTFHLAFVALKSIGIAYLLSLARKLWTASVEPNDLTSAAGGDRGLLLTGLSIGLSNPKTMLFYVALLPCIVTLYRLRLSDLLMLVAIVFVVVGTVLAAYVLLAERMRRLIRSPNALRRINRGSAVLMASAGAWMATR